MNYTNLGNIHMKVSRLCLGTMNFGVRTDEKEAFRIMDMALEAGINFFDTANNYGMAIEKEGITEELIGRWFLQDPAKREQIILNTKVHEPMRQLLEGPNNEPGLSRYKIRRHLEASLKRLRTDHVDIYFMHHYDREMNVKEVVDTFHDLISQGKVNYMGTSNFPAWALADLCASSKYRNASEPVCEQHKYNLLCRMPEMEVIPAIRNYGIGLLAYSPMGNGLLGRCSENDEGNENIKQFGKLCHELGETPADVAVAWLLQNPVVTSAVIGPSRSGQIKDILHAVEIWLPDDFMNAIDECFPGAGEAPQSYAW